MKLVQGLAEASWWEGPVSSYWWVELGFVPLVGRAMSRGVFVGGYCVRRTLDSLSADEWVCVPPCWLFSLRSPSTRACRLLGGSKSQCQNGDLWESSHWWVFPRAFTTSICPHSEQQPTPASPGDPPIVTGSVALNPIGPLLCPGSQCMWNLVWDLQEWSVSPVLWSSFTKPLWPSKPNTLGASPPNAVPPGWGAWHEAQNSHFYGRTSAI